MARLTPHAVGVQPYGPLKLRSRPWRRVADQAAIVFRGLRMPTVRSLEAPFDLLGPIVEQHLKCARVSVG